LLTRYNKHGMTRSEVLRLNREAILVLASKFGARNVRLFGSVARGEQREDSDIDLLVEMEPARSLLDLIGLNQELEDLLGCKVDVVSDRGLDRYIKDEVLAEAVSL
jgi:uncharacterized protein